MQIFLIFIVVVLPFYGWGQSHSDCSSAIEICYPQMLVVPSSLNEGIVREDVDPPCDISEINSTWFSISFSSAGVFYFTITPSVFNNDIDFVLFEDYSHDCESYLPIRCMAAGESLNPPEDSICLGATGLALYATDVWEPPGCSEGQDNFLAAVNVNAGDAYYLMVLEFSQDFDKLYYTIEFVSTAELNCSTGIGNEEANSQIKMQLVPNPVSEQVEIILSEHTVKEFSIQVIDMVGRKCLVNNYGPNDPVIINTIDLPPGIYNVLLFDNDQLIGSIPFVRR